MSPGTVYFEVRSDGTFPMALAKTLSIDFDCQSHSGSFYNYITAIAPTFHRKCPTDIKEHHSKPFEVCCRSHGMEANTCHRQP